MGKAKQVPKSFKVNRIDETDNLLVIDRSFKKIRVCHERTGNEYILKETEKVGLQLTK